ncbi:hypothetical protein NHX12_026019 [Muraenolepis orangiensis]|uniref:Uncharacterized protein n=1 Tax=Muraenolepis orangiensis TaxID=630683 RepID=A0A9Q0EJ31_9TELE|nr:hypothetical protein NHX12_026019 [Muraenolepis orangiensis]
MPGLASAARWSLVGSLGPAEWPGTGAREINQAGAALPVAPLTKPPEEGECSAGEGGGGGERIERESERERERERGGGGGGKGQGQCTPADKHRERPAAARESLRSGSDRGRLIPRHRGPPFVLR